MSAPKIVVAIMARNPVCDMMLRVWIGRSNTWRPHDHDDVLALLTKWRGQIDLRRVRSAAARLTEANDRCLTEFEQMADEVTRAAQSESRSAEKH